MEKLWLHLNGRILENSVDSERPYRDGVRCQIMVQNQDEKDYFLSLNLMHGREIQIDIWSEWLGQTGDILYAGPARPTLPVTYSTWKGNLQ